jgi:transcriptional regulator with XRE-family HTH domain
VSQDDLPEWVLQHRWLVGSRIRAVRKHRRLTQEQLAARIGVDSKTISRAENGRYNIAIDFIATLARALDVPSSAFFLENTEF